MADGYFVGINWNNDGGEFGGDFTDVGEDVTADVLQKDPVTFQYGRDQSRSLSPPRVGSIGFGLCNPNGLYSPENPLSPIASDVAPAAQIKVTETIGGVEYPLMRGRIDSFMMSTSRRDQTVQITGLDDLALLRGNKITTQLYQARRTGDLIIAILDALNWSGPRNIDVGASFLPYWWASNDDAFDLVTALLRAEGPPSVAYVAPDGAFTFRDRHHRLLSLPSLVPQVILSDRPTVPLYDSFTRTVANGWGTADTGQTWTTDGGALANYSVNGTTGQHVHSVIGTSMNTLIPSPGADVTVQANVSVDSVPTGNAYLIFLLVRAASADDAFQARLRIAPTSGDMVLTIRKRVAGVETQLSTYSTGFTYVANTVYRMKFQVDGSNLRAKIWPASAYEPSTWQTTVVDTTFVSADNVGVRSTPFTGVTNTPPITFSFDDFQATTPDDAANAAASATC